MPIKLLLADDHEVIRLGLRAFLKDADIEIVGEATHGDEMIEQTLRLKPDVVLLDICMPVCDGLTALAKIPKQSSRTKFIVLSNHNNQTYIARAVALGATDYLLKDASKKELLGAIKRAVSGDLPIENSLLRQVKLTMAKTREPGYEDLPLTNREFQVLRHIALGLSSSEIGASLGIGEISVNQHAQNSMRKMSWSERTQAAVWAVRKGLV